MAGITHAFVSGVGDGADETLVRPSNWNAAHIGYLFVLKTADEVVNNTATRQDDDHLFFSVGANEIWEFTMVLKLISVSTTPHHSVGWAVPTGATMQWWAAGHIGALAEITTLITPLAAANAASPDSGSTEKIFIAQGIYFGGANAGTLQMKWAQATATAENTTVKANSFIMAHRLA